MNIHPLTVFAKSRDIIARKMEEEFILVSVTGPGGAMEDNIYLLNETGHAIWQQIDGQTTVAQLIDIMAGQYNSKSKEEICQDVYTLFQDLLKYRMILKTKKEG
jgi:Coenzyme PQQ synthesis protein D (PqqD)